MTSLTAGDVHTIALVGPVVFAGTIVVGGAVCSWFDRAPEHLEGGGLPGVVLVEHQWCEADDCDRVICLCEVTDGLPCPGTVERGCSHPDAVVCDWHRLDDCGGCLDDARDDAGVLR